MCYACCTLSFIGLVVVVWLIGMLCFGNPCLPEDSKRKEAAHLMMISPAVTGLRNMEEMHWIFCSCSKSAAAHTIICISGLAKAYMDNLADCIGEQLTCEEEAVTHCFQDDLLGVEAPPRLAGLIVGLSCKGAHFCADLHGHKNLFLHKHANSKFLGTYFSTEQSRS